MLWSKAGRQLPPQALQSFHRASTPARSAREEGALGEPAAGRRARGPGGQPPPGKECEPSAPRGPKQRAAPGAARRRQSTPNSAALDFAGQFPDVQPL